jgi:SulP family sulfate permease
MAFAIASGLPPQAGIYCAVVTGFLISLLGGSMTQIGGPTGAFVVVVSGIVAKYGLDGLFMCTMMAGVLLVLMAFTGMGAAVRFIPRPIVIGFTNGIALLIASTQIKDFLGLKLEQVPSEFFERMQALANALPTFSWQEFSLGAGALALILLFRRYWPQVPGTIVALLGGTTAVALLELPVETIGTRFGGVPSGLPSLHIPAFRPALVLTLLSPAVTVALLGAIESLLSAVVADRMRGGDRHQPNTELFAQGVANLVSPLFGGLPATGAIARTATSIRSGARTPMAGIIHSLTLLAVLLAAAPLARHIPLSVLAAILFVVAYNMGEWKEIPDVVRLSRADAAVWLITFALTVFADLTVAVEVGMVLAAMLFIRRIAQTTTVSEVTPDYLSSGQAHILQDKEIPSYVKILRIHGPFLFGSTEKLLDWEQRLEEFPPIVVLRLRNMTAIDATGMHAIESFAEKLRASGRSLILCGAMEQPAKVMRNARFHEHVGDHNICANVESALERAREIYEAAPVA